MNFISRRTCLQRLALTLSATASASLPLGLRAAEEPVKPGEAESAAIAMIAAKFMAEYQVPGLSVAFAHHEVPCYSEGFGVADEKAGEKMEPKHLFRIASIAKPITSVAIFELVEKGKLQLDDRVFGKEGFFKLDGSVKDQTRLEEITIHHLLTHTSGGWANDGDDPMFSHEAFDHDKLIARTLQDQPLKNAPGTNYAYSNFGYCLLGRIIEKVTNKSYAGFVRQNVLVPSGIGDMQIAGNKLSDRVANEVIYYGRGGEDPYGMNVSRMDSHGGWLASPSDLVKFLIHVADSGQGNLLKEGTVKKMITATQPNPGYASGWAVNEARNRWHSGSLPGTSTIALRTSSGMCWAGFTNARGEKVHGALDQMMWQMAKAVPAWNA